MIFEGNLKSYTLDWKLEVVGGVGLEAGRFLVKIIFGLGHGGVRGRLGKGSKIKIWYMRRV